MANGTRLSDDRVAAVVVKAIPLLLIVIGGVIAWTRTAEHVSFNRELIGRIETRIDDRLDKFEVKLDRVIERDTP